nr:peptidase inhibitor family I36 protein [Streptomyces sp. CBMA123]
MREGASVKAKIRAVLAATILAASLTATPAAQATPKSEKTAPSNCPVLMLCFYSGPNYTGKVTTYYDQAIQGLYQDAQSVYNNMFLCGRPSRPAGPGRLGLAGRVSR